jgi:hypothetical protein
MKRMCRVVLVAAAATLLSGTVLADEPSPSAKISYLKLDQVPGAGSKANAGGGGDEAQLDVRKSEFVRFARTKLEEMNRNHLLSRARMDIRKNLDGTFRAKYHQIDEASMACEISRTQSKSVPYVAVLSYKEQIFAASCPTPDACRNAEFTSVDFIPNRHIFSYNHGAWK